MAELADQRCVSCETGTEPLGRQDAQELGKQIPCWEIKEKSIERTFKFSNFVEAMKFANRITKIAEEENHHPDLHISWGKTRVELSTHKIGGLSRNDFILAAKIDKLFEKYEQAQAI